MSRKSIAIVNSEAALLEDTSSGDESPSVHEERIDIQKMSQASEHKLKDQNSSKFAAQTFFGVRPWAIKLSPALELSQDETTAFPDNRCAHTLGNIIWVCLFGWWFSLLNLLLGLIMLISIIGFPYAKLCLSLSVYWIWPFGKYVVQPAHHGFSECSQLLEEDNPFVRKRKPRSSAANQTPKLTISYFVWAFFASIILVPVALVCCALSWFLVVPISMAKTHWKMIKIIYTNPLGITILSDYASAQSFDMVLCTYQAFSLSYIKYTFMGLNIFMVNMFPLIVAIVVSAAATPKGKGLPDTVQFAIYLLCCIPITFYNGMAISCIAARTNYMIGALLNASFASMTNLILYGSAMRKGGLDDLIKYSVIGALLLDMLAMPGLAMIAGGIKYKEQKFNPLAAGVSSLLLFIAVVGVFSPTIWYQVYGSYNQSCNQCQMVIVPMNLTDPEATPAIQNAVQNVTQILCNMCYTTELHDLDSDPMYHSHARYLIYFCAAILPVAYAVGLVFTFLTHSHVFEQEEHGKEEDLPTWGLPFAIIFMMVNTVIFGVLAEHIVDSIKPTLVKFGIPQSFLGLTLITIVPATTEIVNAVKFALLNQISLSVEIGAASGLQTALIQVPFLVALSGIVHGSQTVGSFVLIFPLLTVFAVILAVITFNYISSVGRTSYFTGASLMAIYAIFLAAFYFIPESKHRSSSSSNPMMSIKMIT